MFKMIYSCIWDRRAGPLAQLSLADRFPDLIDAFNRVRQVQCLHWDKEPVPLSPYFKAS